MAEKKLKVFVAVPTVGVIVDAQFWFWRNSEKKYGDRIEFVWPKNCVRRIFHDFARNALANEFMDATDCDVLAFIDSDIVPSDDIWEMVLKHEKWDLAGAPYPVFMTPNGATSPQVVFTIYDGRVGAGLGIANVPRSGEAFVDGVATGCMFIKREVLTKLARPYFEFRYDEETRQMTIGEDLGFCRKVTDLGYKFYVEYKYACKHFKNVCLLEVNEYAYQYAQRSVAQYDKLIRGQLDTLTAEIKRLREKDAIRSKILSTPGRTVKEASSSLIVKP